MISLGRFEIAMRRKLSKIIRKTHVVEEIPFNTVARMLSLAYYRAKECTTDM